MSEPMTVGKINFGGPYAARGLENWMKTPNNWLNTVEDPNGFFAPNAGQQKSTPETPETVLEEAQRIIYGDREQTYGHPAKNFENIARLWNAYITVKHDPAKGHPTLDTDDVAMMMTLMKIARQTHKSTRDNIVDAIGYLGCIQKMADHLNGRG